MSNVPLGLMGDYIIRRLVRLEGFETITPDSSIQMTLDTYSHVAPGLQEAAANAFDDLLLSKAYLDKV